MDFHEAKMCYTQHREEQKRVIIDFLMDNGFIILTMAGKQAVNPYRTGSGDVNYSAGSNIKPYNLSNWKWVSARRDETEVFVSLQAFDRDPVTGNRHTLMDRVGLYCYKAGEYNPEECFEKMINTGIDLPMTTEKCMLMLDKISELC